MTDSSTPWWMDLLHQVKPLYAKDPGKVILSPETLDNMLEDMIQYYKLEELTEDLSVYQEGTCKIIVPSQPCLIHGDPFCLDNAKRMPVPCPLCYKQGKFIQMPVPRPMDTMLTMPDSMDFTPTPTVKLERRAVDWVDEYGATGSAIAWVVCSY